MARNVEQLIADAIERAVAQFGEAQASQQQQLAETLGGVLLQGARPAYFGPLFATTTTSALPQGLGDGMLAHSPGAVVGICIRETGVGNGVVRLHDGPDSNAPVIWTQRVTNGGGFAGPLAGNAGVAFVNGLFLEVVQGTAAVIEGCVYIRAAEF